MKKLILSIVMFGSFSLLTACGCWDGGCAGYVRPSSCCGASTCSSCVQTTCLNCSSGCTTCGYGYGYNDWY